MNTNGLLGLGVSEVVAPSTDKLIGYAFAEPNGKGILERWLLFTNPRNDFEVRRASQPVASWSLEDWQEKISQLWQPGAYYVWAQADVYRYGETYNGVTWTEIPPSKGLPPPSFPNRSGASFQLDWNECSFPCVRQGDLCGYGYVIDGLTKGSSVEYWLLPADYVPAAAPTSIAPSLTCLAGSLDEFVQLTNKSWQPGATFCITGCINYKGNAPPLVP